MRIIGLILFFMLTAVSAHAQCSTSNLSACPSPPFNVITMQSAVVNLGAFVATDNFPGSLASAAIVNVLGSSGTPDATNNPIGVWQKWGGNYASPQTNPTGYFSAFKTSNLPNVRNQAVFAECQDNAGWNGSGVNNFCEAGRGQSTLNTSTLLGSAYGWTGSAGEDGGATHTYLIGLEGAVGNVSTNAPVVASFNPNSFVSSFVASTFGTKTSDAAYTLSPFVPTGAKYNVGFYVPATGGGGGIATSPISDSAFRSDAASTYGLYLASASLTFGVTLPNNVGYFGENAAGNAFLNLAAVSAANHALIGIDAAMVEVDIANTGVPTVAGGSMNATGYKVGAAVGVSCSAGTVSLTTEVVTNGIVTHC